MHSGECLMSDYKAVKKGYDFLELGMGIGFDYISFHSNCLMI